MIKEIVFDMDMTICALYDVPEWLEKLRAYDPTPYEIAEPMWDMRVLADTLETLRQNGITITVVTWLSKESTPEYDKAVRAAKKEWLERHGFPYDHFHGVKYGATKADSVRRYLSPEDEAILFDDNAKVRQGWHLGATYDPVKENIIEILKELLK